MHNIACFLITLFSFITAYTVDSDNSIYKISNNARINSIGGVHLLSDDISGLFKQPINLRSKIERDSYYSYSTYIDNLINVFQFAYCLIHNDKKNVSIGFLRRGIDDINSTRDAWLYNENGPEFNEINYSEIKTFSDNEIGFLISLSNQLSSTSTINFKLKPNFHNIYSSKGYGFGLDILLFKKINKLNIILGAEDIISYKKWDSGHIEQYAMNAYINLSINYDKFLISSEMNNETDSRYGFEYNIKEIFFLRCGYNEFNKLSYGIGISTEIVNFNYSIINTKNNISNNINQFDIILKFSGLKKIYDNLSI